MAFLCLILLVTAVWVSLHLSLLAFTILGVWMALGLIWAPFAGWFLVRASHDRFSLSNSDRNRRFGIGAAGSALFLVPWVYMMLYYGRKHTIRAVWVPRVYKTLFVVWAAGALQQAIIHGAWALVVVLDSSDLGRFEQGSIISLVLLPFHAGLYAASMRRLRRQWQEDVDRAMSGSVDSAVVDFFRWAYVGPFVLAYLWTLLGMVHYVVLVIPYLCQFNFPTKIWPVCT